MISSQVPRIRLGIVGCGGIADAYFSVLQKVAEIDLKACVDVDSDRRQRAAARLGVPVYENVEQMLDRQELDAAIVLTPPVTHEHLTCLLLAAGCHVLCEKPLATTPAAAQRMIEAANYAHRTLMMASKFRYVEDVAKARALAGAGTIGRVLLFENVFCSRVDMTKRWNSQREIAGGGVLIDNGCHSVDIARYLLGPIDRIQAQFAHQIQDMQVEDTARLLFESESRTMGSVDLSWSLHKEVTSFIRLYGSRGTLEVGWRHSRYKLEGDTSWTTFGSGYDKALAFERQLSNFARSILGLEAPLITADDALWSVRVISAAYRSARSNKWVELAALRAAGVGTIATNERPELLVAAKAQSGSTASSPARA
jgi:predicted dehydrogenase